MTASLPFDALRPFKSRLEAFTPRDTIPWEDQAEQLLRCRSVQGFMGLRSFAQVEAHVTWLTDILSPRAHLLDVGCGPGLYSNRLGRQGFRVTGIDIARPLLDYAQAEAETTSLPCTYLRRSLLTLDFHMQFDAALLINSLINALSAAEVGIALTGLQAALKPGGQFIAEVAILPANFADAPALSEEVSLLARSPWCNQFHALMTRILTFPDQNERVTHYLLLQPDSPPTEYWTRSTLYSIDQLSQLLRQHGLNVQQIHGRNPGELLTPSSQTCFIMGHI